MAYHSPLHILKELGIKSDELDKNAISRLRKKLLAEFTLSDQITIRIGTKNYAKDEVLKHLDDLSSIGDMETHVALFNNSWILNFVEAPGKTSIDPQTINNALHNNNYPDGALQIIWQANQEALIYHLKKRNYLLALNHYELYKQNDIAVQPQLWTAIAEHIVETGTFLASISANSFSQLKISASLQWLTREDWVLFFNSLDPDFYDLIREMVAAVINLTIELQKRYITFCADVTFQTLSLDVDEELKKLLNNNYQVFSKNHASSNSKSNSYPIGLFIAILIGVLRACTTCHSTSHRESTPWMTNEKEYRDVQRRVYRHLDSLKTQNLYRQFADSIPMHSPK